MSFDHASRPGTLQPGRYRVFFFLILSVCLALAACAKPTRGPAVPAEHTAAAIVPSVPNARYYLREDLERMVSDSMMSVERAMADRVSRGVSADAPRHFLAISGGGDKGAFTAGLLNGWTQKGTRPEFDVVTGVSTGSLIAPFAYLGQSHDAMLKEVYTSIGPDDIYKQRSMRAAIWDDALADSSPLQALIARSITVEVLEQIAVQHERGRWLMVVTTDLDSKRPVIWNMGEIARVGTPEALALFRKVLLASAALPGLFPPVMFDVEVEGEPHQELHVDGGVIAQSFLFPPSYVRALEERGLMSDVERHVYLIRNAQFQGKWAEVQRRTIPIYARSNGALFTAGGIGDIYRIYTVAEREGMEFNLVYIPASFDVPKKTEFDTEYMKALYEFGFEKAMGDSTWQHEPPGFESTLAEDPKRPSPDVVP